MRPRKTSQIEVCSLGFAGNNGLDVELSNEYILKAILHSCSSPTMLIAPCMYTISCNATISIQDPRNIPSAHPLASCPWRAQCPPVAAGSEALA